MVQTDALKLAGCFLPINELPSQTRGQWVTVGGIIESAKKKITRSGKTMMFVNIADLTDTLELLVFPKTYETTKDVWVEGSVVCVVGKTSEEEGDDKLFVEKAFEIKAENLDSIAQQFSMGQTHVSQDNRNEKKYEESITLVLLLNEVKDKADNIKNILVKYPGVVQVYLRVGGKTIKTQYQITFDDNLKKELEDLLGEGKIVL